MVPLEAASPTVDLRAVRLASKLLSKAESTDSVHERAALTLRGYRLLEPTVRSLSQDEAPELAGRRTTGRGAPGGPAWPAPPSGRLHAASTSTKSSAAAAYERFGRAGEEPARLSCAL